MTMNSGTEITLVMLYSPKCVLEAGQLVGIYPQGCPRLTWSRREVGLVRSGTA